MAGTGIVTPEGIASYPTLATPDEKGKYGIQLVFTKDADITEIKRAALSVLKEKYGEKLNGGKIVSLDTAHGKANFLRAGNLTLRLPWRDDPDVLENKGYTGLGGVVFIGARTKQPPGVVSTVPNQDGKPSVIEPEAIYPGAIVKALIRAYSYDTDGSLGAALALDGVQFIRDGERLDGRSNVQDVFDADENAVASLSDLTGEEETVAANEGGDDLSDLIG